MDDVGEGSIALDGPSDFGGAAEFARADWGAGEFGFGEASFQDGAGEDFAGFGGGLVDGIGEGAEGGFPEGILGGEEGASFGLGLGEFFLGDADAFADFEDGFEDDGTDDDDGGDEGEDGANDGGEDAFAAVHAPPFLNRAGSSEASSEGRGGGLMLERSTLSLGGTMSSTLEVKS